MCSTQYNHYVDKLIKALAVFQTHDFASNVILNYNFSVKCQSNTLYPIHQAPIWCEKWVDLEGCLYTSQYNNYVGELTKASAGFLTHNFASNIIFNYNFSLKCLSNIHYPLPASPYLVSNMDSPKHRQSFQLTTWLQMSFKPFFRLKCLSNDHYPTSKPLFGEKNGLIWRDTCVVLKIINFQLNNQCIGSLLS